MVDTRDLKSLAFERAGSSPALPTILSIILIVLEFSLILRIGTMRVVG